MSRISRRMLAHAVAGRVAVVDNVTSYYGQIGAANGLPAEDGGIQSEIPESPPVKSPGDQRVKPYLVLFPGLGGPGDEVGLAPSDPDLAWSFSITAAAGDADDLLALVDRIEGTLLGWTPGVLAGVSGPILTGRVAHPPGFVAAPLVDRGVTPSRHFTSLQYQLTAHT